MNNQLKSAAFATVMAFGVASVAHANQPPAATGQRQMPQAAQGMGQYQMMGQPGQAPVMNNPEMRQRMMAMMERCQRMMSRMGAEEGAMPAMQDRQ